MILNASASCPADELDSIVSSAADEISEKYRLEMTVYKKDYFGLGD